MSAVRKEVMNAQQLYTWQSPGGAEVPDVGEESPVRTVGILSAPAVQPRYSLKAPILGELGPPLLPPRLLDIIHCEFLHCETQQRISQSGLLARPSSTCSPLRGRRLLGQLGKDGSPAPARWSLAPQKGHRPGGRARGPMASRFAIRRVGGIDDDGLWGLAGRQGHSDKAAFSQKNRPCVFSDPVSLVARHLVAVHRRVARRSPSLSLLWSVDSPAQRRPSCHLRR